MLVGRSGVVAPRARLANADLIERLLYIDLFINDDKKVYIDSIHSYLCSPRARLANADLGLEGLAAVHARVELLASRIIYIYIYAIL